MSSQFSDRFITQLIQLICPDRPAAHETAALQLGGESHETEAPLLQIAGLHTLLDFFRNDRLELLPVLPRDLGPLRRYQGPQMLRRFRRRLKLLNEFRDIERTGRAEFFQAFTVEGDGTVQRREGRRQHRTDVDLRHWSFADRSHNPTLYPEIRCFDPEKRSRYTVLHVPGRVLPEGKPPDYAPWLSPGTP